MIELIAANPVAFVGIGTLLFAMIAHKLTTPHLEDN